MRFNFFFIAIKILSKKLFQFRYFAIGCTLIICVSTFYFIQPGNREKYGYKKDGKHHKLCLIVPFRERFEELLKFVPHISNFLHRQSVKYHIIVVNQVDTYRFNRGSLINAGFIFASTNVSDCDYIAMHDVDLLPLNANLSYAYPENDVFHVSSPSLHPRYHYRTFIGGILLINREQFKLVNGLSNRYWGWGMEDDEFFQRLKEQQIKIMRPKNIFSNSTNTFRHIHGPLRKRDFKRCFNQTYVNRKRDRITGLNNINYEVTAVNSISIDNHVFNLLNIKLFCNERVTPWCICH